MIPWSLLQKPHLNIKRIFSHQKLVTSPKILPQPEILIGCDRDFRWEFISDRNRLTDFPSEIRSDLISDQISDLLSDRILFPIGFPVWFLSTFRSDSTIFYQNFRLEILSEFRARTETAFKIETEIWDARAVNTRQRGPIQTTLFGGFPGHRRLNIKSKAILWKKKRFWKKKNEFMRR